MSKLQWFVWVITTVVMLLFVLASVGTITNPNGICIVPLYPYHSLSIYAPIESPLHNTEEAPRGE